MHKTVSHTKEQATQMVKDLENTTQVKDNLLFKPEVAFMG